MTVCKVNEPVSFILEKPVPLSSSFADQHENFYDAVNLLRVHDIFLLSTIIKYQS